jgi:hypothetical protein
MEGSGADAYDQSDATGFIRLNALRLKARGAAERSYKKQLARRQVAVSSAPLQPEILSI